MLALAPHMPRSTWGLALRYAAEIDAVLPKQSNNGKSPIEVETGRPPSQATHPRHVFGCDMAYKLTGDERYAKLDPLTGEAYFCGIENYQYLLKHKDTNEVFKISRRKVRPMEMQYTKPQEKQTFRA